jgi:hypothetical protein
MIGIMGTNEGFYMLLVTKTRSKGTHRMVFVVALSRQAVPKDKHCSSGHTKCARFSSS